MCGFCLVLALKSLLVCERNLGNTGITALYKIYIMTNLMLYHAPEPVPFTNFSSIKSCYLDVLFLFYKRRNVFLQIGFPDKEIKISQF